MRDFGAFMREGKFPDIVIQMALREVDAEPLARALVDQDEEVREMIFRNMSQRAVVYLKEDIRKLVDAAPESIKAGQELYARLLGKNAALFAKEGVAAFERQVATPPPIDLSGRQAIISTFCNLSMFAKDNGLLALEGIRESVENPLMRKGLLMLVEGWDPLLLRSVLERYKESWLRAKELEYDLIIEGIDSLGSKDNYVVMEEKLASLVAGL